MDTFECINQIEGYEGIGLVTSIKIFNGQLISGSMDGKIKLWDFGSGSLLANLEGHTGKVTSLDIVNDEVLISSCSGHTMKLWDWNTLTCIDSLTNKTYVSGPPLVFDGKLICGNWSTEIDIWDFRADNDAILNAIVTNIKENALGLRQTTPDALERFSRLPKRLRNKVYVELYSIIKPRLIHDYWGCAEHAFHGTHGQFSTPSEQMEAIQNFLAAEERNLDEAPLSLLSEHLGALTKEEFSEKLRCRPRYLQQIGILSAEDLKIICPLSSDIQILTIEEVSGVRENFRDDEAKRKAHDRQEALSDLSNKLIQVVTNKIQETNTCGVLLYEGDCPWISFQNKLTAFREKFDALVLQCNNLPKLAVETFTATNYNELANELNVLVGQFQVLDRDHQIIKLHAYINQWGILKAWQRRQGEGTQQSLQDLPESERVLQKLFQMGE